MSPFGLAWVKRNQAKKVVKLDFSNCLYNPFFLQAMNVAKASGKPNGIPAASQTAKTQEFAGPNHYV